MTNDTKDKIIKLLNGASSKAEKFPSIDEQRKYYRVFLAKTLEFIDTDEVIDVDSDEISELITDNFLKIKADPPVVFEEEGYKPWLDNCRNDICWDFYNRYEKYLLEKKHWKPKAISDLKKSSDIILDHIANPKTINYFGKQGLVIGDIQSGKTANYTALINKAIDVGYKIIIVLAGLTRDLRNQTQRRLDAEVLGYETKMLSKGKTIGVGSIKPLHIEGLTCADDKKDYGDMKKYFATHSLDEKLNPIVAVVKKNTSVLDHLNKFIVSSPDYCYTNKKLDIPVLIIDDEVDQASVDTKDSDEIEGASAINKKIRTILSSLNRYSYVGYTATPFANVFVDPERKDIYPKDFILCLPSNEDYCGIKEYFGVDIIEDDESSSDHVQDLFVNVADYGELFSKDEKKISAGTITASLNNSLKDAIKSFVLASSIKKSRGFKGFNSMLIHIARYKNPATTLKPLVSDYLSELYHGLKYESEKFNEEFEKFWIENFREVSELRLGESFKDNWDAIFPYLLPTVESAMNNTKVLNGDSGDALDYSSSDTGDFIVIGGDKLSRGLTLEGLVVSYYYRRSRAYDSLLQMGRWFGYRKGWIDVCRVYTTVSFMNDFITVGKVLQKFKSDMHDMYAQRLNPREVGQRILYSPNLIPTSRNKMKKTEKIKISFSGELQQIITFNRSNVAFNLDLTREFISKLGSGEVRSNNKVVFKHVKSQAILDYLKRYKECNSIYGFGLISIRNWANYIENLNQNDELNDWTVVLNSLQSKKKEYDNSINIGGYTVFKPARSLRDEGDPSKAEFYTVKTNSDPTDFREFFDPASEQYKEIDHYDAKKDYPGFDSTKAILSIYVIDLFEKVLTGEYDAKTNKKKAKRGPMLSDGMSVCAPAIWFSKTKDYEKSATLYYVSQDYIKLESKQKEADLEEFGDETND